MRRVFEPGSDQMEGTVAAEPCDRWQDGRLSMKWCLIGVGICAIASTDAILSTTAALAQAASAPFALAPSRIASPTPLLTPSPITPITTAQNIPSNREVVGDPSRPQPPAPDFQPLVPNPPGDLDPTILQPPSQPNQPDPGDLGQPAKVTGYQIQGKTLLPQSKINEVTKPYTSEANAGAAISPWQWQQAAQAVTKLYLDEGYISSGVKLPVKPPVNGVVTLEVSEGRVEYEDIQIVQICGWQEPPRVNAAGNVAKTTCPPGRLKPDYIRQRIALGLGRPLNYNQLLSALQLLRQDPLIDAIQVDIVDGIQFGTSHLKVTVQEAKSRKAVLTLDNGRSPSVGTFRRAATLSEANLTGWGDGLTVGYSNTEGSHAANLSYRRPINAQEGTWSVDLSLGQSHIVEDPFNVLDIETGSLGLDLEWRQPIVRQFFQPRRDPNQPDRFLGEPKQREIALGTSLTYRLSRSRLLNDVSFPAIGADENGRTQALAARFFQEGIWRSQRSVLFLRSQFSVGLLGNQSPTPPDSRFIAWRGQAQWGQVIGRDNFLTLRGDLQVTNRPVLPLEQFGIGGLGSVRAYRQDYLLADGGLFLSAELRLPIVRAGENTLSLVPFIDFGTAWNRSGPNKLDLDPQSLAAAGLGLQWQSKDLFARLDWGLPLTSVSGGSNLNSNTWQENGVYFSLRYSFL